jgi:predicted dehydrogenase
MRFLVIGLGSMGKRRIRCLKRLGYENITGFDLRLDRCKEVIERYNVEAQSDWEQVKSLDSDAWLICTPPDQHLAYAQQACSLGRHFFTEAGVPDPKIADLINTLERSNLVGVPSCTMRYYQGPKKIRELVEAGAIGKPLLFAYHWGQYLPTWHTYESYQEFYVSKPETGAGREIVPFQLEWLVNIFGMPQKISCFKGKLSDLDTDIDDIYQLQLSFGSGMMGNLIVEVLSQPAVNRIRIVGAEGTIEFDQHENSFKLYSCSQNEWMTIELEKGAPENGYLYAEEPYVEEMKDFIAAILGQASYPYTFPEDLRILELLTIAEQSAQQERQLSLAAGQQ